MSLNPSALSNEKGIYPIETGYAFTLDRIRDLAEKFNNQTSHTEVQFYNFNPKNLIAQHIPVKGNVNKTKVNRMRNGFIVDTLTRVDIQELVEIRGKVREI